MSNKHSKLPIILLLTGCVAGGALGYSYNKITANTNYIFLKTGKNLYSETKNSLNSNITYKETLNILDKDYKVGLTTNTDKIGVDLSYDTALSTYDFDLSFFGYDKEFSFESLPFFISSASKQLSEEQEASINNIKNYYTKEFVTLFFNSETSNTKYNGDENYNRELVFTLNAGDVNSLYESYIEEVEAIVTEDLLEDVEISTENNLKLNLKNGVLKSTIKNNIEKKVEEFKEEHFLSKDVVITLYTKHSNIAKIIVEADYLNLTVDFNSKNYLNSETIVTLQYKDNEEYVVKINPTFDSEIWSVNVRYYNVTSPNIIGEITYTWDLLEEEGDNFRITTNIDNVVEEKVYTIEGNSTEGVSIKSENLAFYLEKSSL